LEKKKRKGRGKKKEIASGGTHALRLARSLGGRKEREEERKDHTDTGEPESFNERGK